MKMVRSRCAYAEHDFEMKIPKSRS